MKLLLTGCLILVLIVAVTPVQAQQSWVLYDDFNGTLLEYLFGKPIDPNKWVSNLTNPDDILDISREIRWNQLHILNGSYNFSKSCEPTSCATNTGVRLRFPHPNQVIGIQATVMVNAYELSPCNRNRIRGGRLSGFFFKTAEGSPESNVGDVLAAIQVQRSELTSDPPNVFHVVANAFQCTDDECLRTNSLNCDGLDLGTVRLHEKTRLSIQWDRDTSQFIFQRDNDPPRTCLYPNTLFVGPANRPSKGLDVSNRVVQPLNCAGGVASMDVLVDDVFVILTDDAFAE